MTRFALIPAAALAAAALAAPAAGQDPNATYTIKFHKEAVGDRTAVTKTERKRMQIDANVNGMPIKKDTTEADAFAYTQTVVDKPDPKKKPAKLTRDYAKAEVTRDGNAQQLPFAGKTVEIAKGPGGYAFTIAGGAAVAGADAEPLRREFAKDEDNDEKFLPKNPVRLNEPWKIDLRAFAGGDDFPLDVERSTATGKLTKVYQKGGRQFGVIELNIEMVVRDKAEGSIRVTGTIDACIDGAVNEGKMSVRMAGALNVPIPNGGTAKMTMDVTVDETRTPVK